MRRVGAKDTGPEMVVRRLLHRMGYRFRLHNSVLPGRPDIVLLRYRAAVFVHGCFWHQHTDPLCKLARMPKTRREFWEPKLLGNRVRDERNMGRLREEGWRVFVVWECKLSNMEQLENNIREWLEGQT